MEPDVNWEGAGWYTCTGFEGYYRWWRIPDDWVVSGEHSIDLNLKEKEEIERSCGNNITWKNTEGDF